MSLTGASISRFRRVVDKVLADAFPADLRRAGIPLLGVSSPGGRITTDYIEGGESSSGRYPFRIPISSLTAAPLVGDSYEWVIDSATTVLLEVVETSLRPHEDRYQITCRQRRA